MKTLVNKNNPQIRVIAPEITTAHPPVSNEGYVYWIPAINEMYNPIDWTLVEEDPVKEEICSKCVHHHKDDDCCYYPYGGMQRRINENGVYECTGFCEEEPANLEKKYIDAEKLKAKIERCKGYISVTHFAEELLSFIDSLPQEPTEGLKAIKEE